MRRNLELENWLIETTGEEMMANHLGTNWNRFNDEMGFYPNMTMTVADQVWQHQQSKVDEMQKRVDEALRKIDQFFCEGNLDSLEKAEQALKGGCDASN